ncbi:MAG: glycosyltransferase [Candidatus Limnocylindria bacterium]
MPDARDRTTVTRGLFVVWGPPLKGRRSVVLGTALGVEEVAYLADDWTAGLLSDPMKYPRLALRTIRLLMKRRPRVVFVQTPPTLAVWLVAAYARAAGAAFIVDAHSDAFQRSRWTRPRWLNRLVARRALATLVTDPYWAARLESDGATAMVVPDVPRVPDAAMDREPLGPGFHVLVVNTWGSDEPLAEVLAAAAQLPDVTFHVTGRRDARFDALGSIASNVRFTDFLSDNAYQRLMRSVHAVACLTTRDHTMQRGACESLSSARPIVTSDWGLLRSYFSRGTVFVDNSPEGIRDGIGQLMAHYDEYAHAIETLRTQRLAEWATRRTAIIELITASDPRGGSTSPGR